MLFKVYLIFNNALLCYKNKNCDMNFNRWDRLLNRLKLWSDNSVPKEIKWHNPESRGLCSYTSTGQSSSKFSKFADELIIQPYTTEKMGGVGGEKDWGTLAEGITKSTIKISNGNYHQDLEILKTNIKSYLFELIFTVSKLWGRKIKRIKRQEQM